MNNTRNMKEIGAGLVFCAIAIFVFFAAKEYEMGTATSMGPGYFPTILSILLFALGAISAVRGLRASEQVSLNPWPVVPAFFVLAGVALFAMLVDRFGLVVALVALVALSCFDRWRTRPIEMVIIGALMIAFNVAVFIYGLQLPINIWKTP